MLDRLFSTVFHNEADVETHPLTASRRRLHATGTILTKRAATQSETGCGRNGSHAHRFVEEAARKPCTSVFPWFWAVASQVRREREAYTHVVREELHAPWESLVVGLEVTTGVPLSGRPAVVDDQIHIAGVPESVVC